MQDLQAGGWSIHLKSEGLMLFGSIDCNFCVEKHLYLPTLFYLLCFPTKGGATSTQYEPERGVKIVVTVMKFSV
jgi:hypothetical protein